MNQIVEAENKDAVASEGGFNSALEMAIKQGATAETIHSLIDAQERVLNKNAEIAFNNAMARLQPELPEIKKASKAHNSKYAKYEHIEREVRPLYTKEGFSIRYNSEVIGEGEKYTGTLMHVDGHSVTASMVLPPDGSGSKNAIQAKGSTVSYAKRYLLCMLLNIVTTDEDDDGNAADGVISEEQVAYIEKLLEETETDKIRFCTEYAKVDALTSLNQAQYKKCIGALKARKNKGAA